MKVTPVSSGTLASGAVGEVSTQKLDPGKIERAMAAMVGETKLAPSDTPIDPQVTKTQESIRKIQMKTNVSPDRPLEEMPTQGDVSATPLNNEQAVQDGAIEETKPLSPQAAALAKQRRALQVKERELLAREQAIKSAGPQSGANDLANRLKTEPLKVLQEYGALNPDFYNAMTEYLVSGNTYNPEMEQLKAEVKSLKEGIDKTFTERDQTAKSQALNEMRKEAEYLAKDGEAFELIRETRSIPKVVDLIDRTYETTGEVLDVQEAMNLIENELLERELKIARAQKIQSKLQIQMPAQGMQPQPTKQMKTLTNRDTAQQPMDRRARAIMAAQGLLRK